MQKKGQVAVDFFYVVLGLLIVIQGLQAINSEFKATQTEKTISSQLRQAAEEISLMIDIATTLSQENSQTTIELDTKKVFVPDTIGKQPCEIEVQPGKIIVSKQFSGKTFKASSEFLNPASFNISPSNLECGEKITIKK